MFRIAALAALVACVAVFATISEPVDPLKMNHNYIGMSRDELKTFWSNGAQPVPGMVTDGPIVIKCYAGK